MDKEIVIFLHGFATLGGIKSGRGLYFYEKFASHLSIDFYAIDFNPTPKDFQSHTITGMIDRLRQFIIERGFGKINLIAISQGANVALNYAHRYGGVKRLLFLAPELSYDAYATEEELKVWAEIRDEPVFHYGFEQEILLNYGHHQDGLRYISAPPPPASMVVIHGVNDQAIPIEHSRKYAERYADRVRLIEVDSKHLLKDQDEEIWRQTSKMFGL
jgi:pimeloyl-ACP methyl ester carboxylesterase